MTEQQLTRDIIKYLRSSDLYAERMNAGTIQNQLTGTWVQLADIGTPDIIACLPDQRLWFIEVKLPSGRLSDPQIFFLREQERRGRAWMVATSLQDVIRGITDPEYHGEPRFTKYVLDTSTRFVLKPRRDKRLRASDMLAHELWTKRGEAVHNAEDDAKNPLF